MNYAKLSQHGFKYLIAALDNWHWRQQKIMRNYCADNPQAFRIFNKLEDRKLVVAKIIVKHKEKMHQQKIEADHQQIMLRCKSFDCMFSPVGIGISIYAKDYAPGKYFCEALRK